ncbi:MAG TPA: aldehyde dehydrogenase family protein [Candidatus Limnocylindria bacterium]|nr:aldehyde dehydrogenase family protein [Candidatus Limnocylindria bacterium]
MAVTDVTRAGLIIGGSERDAKSGATFESIDPSTGRPFAVVARADAEDIDVAVATARDAFENGPWTKMKPAERARLLWRMAELIRRDAASLAVLESRDNGKPLRQAKTDVEVAARYFEFYAGVADKLMGRTIPVTPGLLDYTLREPIGVSGQIVPWNYPIQIGARGAAPALAAGCCVVMKPSSEAPMTALALGKLGIEAGLPPSVFNVVPGSGATAGERLAAHPGVDQITFTGSVETGIHVMKLAAEHVAPVTLELGGKSPNVVFADADMDITIAGVANAIFQNAGQTCSAGSRLLVEAAAHDQVVDLLTKKVQSMKLGPGVEDPDMGPLISRRQLEKVMGYVETGKREGAVVAAGGTRPGDPRLGDGFFIDPTLLDRVEAGMRVHDEEIFGPVLAISTFGTVEEAARLANRSEYGLVAGVWTRDINKALFMADRIRSGQVYVNTYGAGGGVELPFGGYKKSGFGREKGLQALDSYLQTKNVCIKFA